MNQTNDEIDPYLNDLFDGLRATPPRDPDAVAQGRTRFVQELDDLYSDQITSIPVVPHGRLRFMDLKEKFAMMTRNQRSALTVAALVMVVLVILFGSAGMTAYAAQSALPGDALYPVKTGLEERQLDLSKNAANQIHLNLRFAERRTEEIAGLIAEGRYMDIEAAAREYELHIQNAISSVKSVAQIDPGLAAQLTAEITDALSRYSQVLSNMTSSVPSSVRPQINRLLQTAQEQDRDQVQGEETEITGLVEEIGPDYYVIAGQKILVQAGTEVKDTIVVGDLVKVHAVITAGGAMVIREIELADGLEDGNGNENENGNDNSNANSNTNVNTNTNTNTNMNTNSNANSNTNSNSNSNGNSNHNGGGNDNGGNSNDDD